MIRDGPVGQLRRYLASNFTCIRHWLIRRGQKRRLGGTGLPILPPVFSKLENGRLLHRQLDEPTNSLRILKSWKTAAGLAGPLRAG